MPCASDGLRPKRIDSADVARLLFHERCRDLLFHVQEHRLTLAEIESFLQENGLTFLGFELDFDVRAAYQSRSPNDPASTNLGQWQIFEQEHPATFIAMYQFWIQKTAAA